MTEVKRLQVEEIGSFITHEGYWIAWRADLSVYGTGLGMRYAATPLPKLQPNEDLGAVNLFWKWIRKNMQVNRWAGVEIVDGPKLLRVQMLEKIISFEKLSKRDEPSGSGFDTLSYRGIVDEGYWIVPTVDADHPILSADAMVGDTYNFIKLYPLDLSPANELLCRRFFPYWFSYLPESSPKYWQLWQAQQLVSVDD